MNNYILLYKSVENGKIQYKYDFATSEIDYKHGKSNTRDYLKHYDYLYAPLIFRWITTYTPEDENKVWEASDQINDLNFPFKKDILNGKYYNEFYLIQYEKTKTNPGKILKFYNNFYKKNGYNERIGIILKEYYYKKEICGYEILYENNKLFIIDFYHNFINWKLSTKENDKNVP